MQKAILGILVLLAIAGGAAAYVFYGDAQELATQLEDIRGERTKLESALDSARTDLQAQIASAGSVEEIDRKVKAAEARVQELDAQVRAKQQEMIALTSKIEADSLELGKLYHQLSERMAALHSVQEELVSAENERNRLRAAVADLQSTFERTRQEAAAAPPVAALTEGSGTPTASPAATAAAAATAPAAAGETGATDKVARAQRRFKLLDKNGDGVVDEFEFRLNSIRLMGAIDRNGDGVVTRDETLLSPEQFRLFDLNGDSKVSSLEFVEAFRILDRDGKGTVTLEEYNDFIETAAK